MYQITKAELIGRAKLGVAEHLNEFLGEVDFQRSVKTSDVVIRTMSRSSRSLVSHTFGFSVGDQYVGKGEISLVDHQACNIKAKAK